MKFIPALVVLLAIGAIAGSAYSVIARDYPPRLSVSIEGVPSYVYYNRPYDLTIRYANHGGATDKSVQLTAVLPPGFALQGRQGGITVREQTMVWQLGKLAASDSGEVHITIKGVVPQDLNNAVYTLPGYEGHVAFEEGFEMPVTLTSGRHAATTLAVADTGAVIPLAVGKTGPATRTAGTVVTYTITLDNIGGAALANVALADTIPANTTFVSATAPAGWTLTTPVVGGTGTITATNPSMAIGSSYTFSFVMSIDDDVTDGLVITNAAAVTVGGVACCEASVNTTVVPGDLTVTKTGTPESIPAGENLTYTLTVTNSGPADAELVTLTDVLPLGTTFVSMVASAGWTITTPAVGGTGMVTASIPTLPPGSAVFSLVVSVDGATPDGTQISNTAIVEAASGDSDQSNNSATEMTPVGDGGTIMVELEVIPSPMRRTSSSQTRSRAATLARSTTTATPPAPPRQPVRFRWVLTA